MKDIAGKNPKYRMGDGAKEITKAGVEVFGDYGTRLMCWPHVFRNTTNHLASIRREDKNLADKIARDIEELQWSAHNEETFRYVYKLLVDQYLNGNYEHRVKEHLEDFFDYFTKQWVDSPTFRWYEGAHPFSVSNNQGIEGQNKEIKAGHTFKRKCALGTFFKIVEKMVDDFGKKNDEILFNPRIILLDHPEFRNGLKLKTEGYQWLKSNKAGAGDRIVCINPGTKYTVSEDFGLGKVDKIWAVTSSSNSMTNLSLKARAKKRIEERGKPTAASFQEYSELRSSCWLIEERDGDYYCDCPISMKGKLCKHTNGLNYMNGKLEVTSQVRSVPIGQKRKRGRPKNPPSCLTRSPPANPAPTVSARASSPEQVSSDPDSPSPCLPEAVLSVSPESVSPVPLRRSKRKVGASAGLSNQAPPKKKCRTRKCLDIIMILLYVYS